MDDIKSLTGDEKFMLEAINQAKKGMGFTNPNPMVGAVIVKNGQIIAKGYHKKYGDLHAERDAIKNCIDAGKKEEMKGATIYVSLEPCCHYGKQPPCTNAIIEAGFKRVVYGSLDPNPLVAGKGLEILKLAGIKVIGPVLNEECLKLNDIFFHYITKKKPLVTLKIAQTLDGKIATYTGESKWITGEEARENVHIDRQKNMAILVGIGTVLKDDPMLNCRAKAFSDYSHPIRIVCDSNLKTPIDSKIVKTAREVESIIVTNSKDEALIKNYEKMGVKILRGFEKIDENGHSQIDLGKLIYYLGNEKIDSIIIEGGGSLNYSALKEQIVDRIQVYISPKIFGGKDAKTGVEGLGISLPKDAFKVDNIKLSRLNEDLLLEGNVLYS